MAGYGRRKQGRPLQGVARFRRRRQALNEALAAAETNSQRIGAAAQYAMGAVKHASAKAAENATAALVKALVDAGDRLLMGEGEGQ